MERGYDQWTAADAASVLQWWSDAGVDVVIDNVGEATWKHSLGALGKRGRLVTCGGTSGPMVETDVRRLFWNQWTIMGSTMGNDDEARGPEPDASDWMTCPACDGTGQAGGRPCVMCAGSGKLRADVAEDPDDSAEMEAGPTDDG